MRVRTSKLRHIMGVPSFNAVVAARAHANTSHIYPRSPTPDKPNGPFGFSSVCLSVTAWCVPSIKRDTRHAAGRPPTNPAHLRAKGEVLGGEVGRARTALQEESLGLELHHLRLVRVAEVLEKVLP